MEETNAIPVAAETQTPQAQTACCAKTLIRKIGIFYKVMAAIVPVYIVVMTTVQWVMIFRSGIPLTDRAQVSQMLVGTLYSLVVGIVVASLFYVLAWMIDRISALEARH